MAIADVSLVQGGRTVLSRISLDIAPGEFVGVLGANGAGKTTLMRAILGLLRPAQGRISVFGQSIGRGNPLIGYMPQVRAAPVARLDGRTVVTAALDGQRWGVRLPGPAARREVDRVFGLVQATALAPRPLSELSGGERQRLLLAQALLGQPKLLLLDEPLISLDPSRQAEVVGLVRDLQRSLGIAVLFSAHELNPLLGALDRVLYLGGGQAALGSVDEVITSASLSRLYGAPIEVVRIGGRIFVMSGSHDVERDAHGPCAGHQHTHTHDHAARASA
ncbi:metal ABC transporter ATP-binding protein [Lichenicola sp.]|uniref:metal ABC transporter ATP-binding protein n=1 Tax=Lichenicola sp. TaxID=2804529 RepID=UPI003B0082FF